MQFYYVVLYIKWKSVSLRCKSLPSFYRQCIPDRVFLCEIPLSHVFHSVKSGSHDTITEAPVALEALWLVLLTFF